MVAVAPAQSAAGGIARYRYGAIGALRPGDRAEAERLVHEGGLAYERNRPTDALALYRQAAQADPTCFDAQYNLGVTAYESGDLGQALSAYESALALESESLKARYNFAATLERAGYPRDAALELERLLPRHPAETRIHLKLGNLYARKLAEPDQASRHYRKVLELEPRHPEASAIRFWLEANP
jgi:tetratricopeptide (TPR) repeat protein